MMTNTDKSMQVDNPYKMIVMHNDLVRGKQDLGINEAKLLRLTIMQCNKSDKEFLTYNIKLTKLAELLDISSSNLYRDIRKICINLLRQIVFIGDHDQPAKSWKAFQWCSEASYDSKSGYITIRLHDNIKP